MMATYFHGGSEIQGGGGDNLQTLYLMNPNLITAYSCEGQAGSNMVFVNPGNTQGNGTLPHQQQQLILPSEDHGRPSSSSLEQQISRVHPNLWSPSGPDIMEDHNMMGFRRPQGLSLSLLSPGQQTVAGGSSIIGSKYLKPAQELLEELVNVGGINFNDNPCTRNNNNNNIGESSGAHKDKAKAAAKDPSTVGDGQTQTHGGSGVGETDTGGGNNNKAPQLSTAHRQEQQMKKAKLLNMLHEVEQRYRQYNRQLQVVVSSFEQAAGIGSAKLYTSLALKTISKQFRSLKDAIMSQIKATSKSLGEDETNSNTAGVKLEGGTGSRLRFVDNQLRQQRALQQLGMMQHNAWRPQRGLPERAVSVLRAWLFEHFLHPYPKDSDKHMLAKQTGLTRSQVSNWFINARVRLWKPMVEEMYLEEVKTTQEQNNGGNWEDNESNKIKSSTTKYGKSWMNDQSTSKEEEGGTVIQQQHTTNDMISAMSSQGFPKKQRSNVNSPSSILSMDMEMMKPVNVVQRPSFLMTANHGDAAGNPNPNPDPYLLNEMTTAGRFNNDEPIYHGNAVSLTLGLPHDSETLSLTNHHQTFLPNQFAPGGDHPDFCMPQSSHPNHAFPTIHIQNRKTFAAHLLHHFVA